VLTKEKIRMKKIITQRRRGRKERAGKNLPHENQHQVPSSVPLEPAGAGMVRANLFPRFSYRLRRHGGDTEEFGSRYPAYPKRKGLLHLFCVNDLITPIGSAAYTAIWA